MKTIVQTPTKNLNTSLEFYEKLNFHPISTKNPTLFTDSNVIIEVNTDRFARPGIKLISNSWTNVINKIKIPIINLEPGYLIQDNNGVFIYLVEDEAQSIDLNVFDSQSVLGSFAGISIETLSIKESILFWKVFNFTVVAGEENSSWVSLSNGELTISFMLVNNCPHLFYNPSLTYFNGNNNLEIINKIRQLKINFVEEITHFNNQGIVDNVIIKDPGGLGFFIFND